MKKLSIVLILSCLGFSPFPEDEKQLSHYIGGAAGFSTGAGLSYRYWPGNWGTQVVFTPIWNPTGGTSFMFGSGAFRTLHETQYTRLFLFIAGNGIYQRYVNREEYDYSAEPDENYNYPRYPSPKITVSESIGGAIGVGPGLEIYLFKNIVLNIMFGFRYGFNSGIDGVGFTAETALYYRF
jgi:hypothetical protein